jgi:prolyl oligopeptidase
VLDLLRFSRFTGGKYWEPELGSVANAEEFSVLRKRSPLHNVTPGCYPPTRVMIGEDDQTAVPLHGDKYTAALQNAQTCTRPAVMKVMKGAGHNFGATPEQVADSFADALAFAFTTVGR